MVSPVERADIQRLEARRAQLLAAQKANQDIKPLLTPKEQYELETEGFDKVIEGIDGLVNYIKTQEHI